MEDAVRIFRLVATEFDVLNDETVEAWLNLTAPLISKKVFGKLYDQAIALLTAHRAENGWLWAITSTAAWATLCALEATLKAKHLSAST